MGRFNKFHGAFLRGAEEMYHKTSIRIKEAENGEVHVTIQENVTPVVEEPKKHKRARCISKKVELIASSNPRKAWAIAEKHAVEQLSAPKVEVTLPSGHIMKNGVEYVVSVVFGHTKLILASEYAKHAIKK